MKKRILLCACLSIVLLTLSGCSVDVYGTHLEGVNVIWTPFIAVWHWLWGSFTPSFWIFVEQVWQLPLAVSWLAGIIVNLLGAVLYIVIVVLIIAIDLVLAILIGIVWFILALLNGIFHFM